MLLVDTNVILDVAEDDARWADWSQQQLEAASRRYTLLINPVINAELSTAYLRRTLATVTCAGVNVNAEQVRRGWAWVFERYAPKNSPLYGIQADARLARRGLWADDDPKAPWEWRRRTQ